MPGRTTFLRLAAVLCLSSCGGDSEGNGDPPLAEGGPPACSPSDATSGFYPCDVEVVLRERCQICHNERAVTDVCEANNTCVRGPFSLVDWTATQQVNSQGRPRYVRMAEVIRSGEMPYQSSVVMPPIPRLTDAEKQTLLAWLDACAPSAPSACQ